MTDIIGDIHGHADELKVLLSQLGYIIKNGAYQNPDRRAIFVGDYIDRGKQIPEVLRIVRGMVESDSAVALLGNHEYNALCFHFEHKEGGHLRKHSIKNILQHYETLQQFRSNPKEYEEFIRWFKTLPLYYESSQFRVVHACWDNQHITYLKSALKNDRLDDEKIYQSTVKGTDLYKAIDQTLKGKEIGLPEGCTFEDEDENVHREMRIKWWENPQKSTYSSLSIKPIPGIPNDAIEVQHRQGSFYSSEDIPVFFGHYWLEGEPFLHRDNICCVDFSVAQGGHLVCYSFNDETRLDKDHFVSIPCVVQ